MGFATGVERLMEMFEEANKGKINKRLADLYVLTIGEKENIKAIQISEELREKDFYVEKDLCSKSFKAQMKYADKIGAKNLLVIGEDELLTGKAKIKNMKTGEEKEVELEIEKIVECIK